MNNEQKKESLYARHVWAYTGSSEHGRHIIIELLYAFFYPFYAISKYASNIGAIGFGLWIIAFILLNTVFDSPASYRFGEFITNYGLLAVLALILFGFPLRWVFSHITRSLLHNGLENARDAMDEEVGIYLRREARLNVEMQNSNGKFWIEKRRTLDSYGAFKVFPDGHTEFICPVESPEDRERYKFHLKEKKRIAKHELEWDGYEYYPINGTVEKLLDEVIYKEVISNGYESTFDYSAGKNQHDDN